MVSAATATLRRSLFEVSPSAHSQFQRPVHYCWSRDMVAVTSAYFQWQLKPGGPWRRLHYYGSQSRLLRSQQHVSRSISMIVRNGLTSWRRPYNKHQFRESVVDFTSGEDFWDREGGRGVNALGGKLLTTSLIRCTHNT